MSERTDLMEAALLLGGRLNWSKYSQSDRVYVNYWPEIAGVDIHYTQYGSRKVFSHGLYKNWWLSSSQIRELRAIAAYVDHRGLFMTQGKYQWHDILKQRFSDVLHETAANLESNPHSKRLNYGSGIDFNDLVKDIRHHQAV